MQKLVEIVGVFFKKLLGFSSMLVCFSIFITLFPTAVYVERLGCPGVKFLPLTLPHSFTFLCYCQFLCFIYIYQPACILRWTLDSICLAISFKLELTSNSFSWGCSMSTQNLWYSQKASGIKSVFPQSVECTSLTLGIWI